MVVYRVVDGAAARWQKYCGTGKNLETHAALSAGRRVDRKVMRRRAKVVHFCAILVQNRWIQARDIGSSDVALAPKLRLRPFQSTF